MPVWPDPRSIRVGFAFGATQYDDPFFASYETVSPADDPDDGDDPGPVLQRVVVRRGRTGDAAETAPTAIDLSMRNENGEFSPLNVSGPRYGTLRNGTPVKVSIDVGSGDEPFATGFALDFIPSRSGPGIDPQVSVPALGSLARLARDTELQSAMRRTLGARPSRNLVAAYWPMEEDDQATVFSAAMAADSAIADGLPATFENVDLSADSSLAGSKPLPVFTSAGQIVGPVSAAFSGAWSVVWFAKFAAAPAARVTLMEVYATGGSADRWLLEADTTTIYLTGYLGGASVHSLSGTTGYSTLFGGSWVYIIVHATDSFGGIFEVQVASVDSTTPTGPAAGASVTPGSVTSVRIPASTQLADMALGHLGVFNDFAGGGTTSALGADGAALGYAGEPARDRIERLLFEADLVAAIPAAASQAMGVLAPTTTYRALRDAEDVDAGMLYELPNGQLTFTAIDTIYNRPVDLVLDFGTDEEPGEVTNLVPGDGDRDTYNIATVSAPDGTFAVFEQSDGPKGSDQTTGIGPRRVTASRNVYQANQLPGHAGWIVRRGTDPHPPYILALDLFNNPDLAADWLACRMGSRIQITGAPAEDYGPDTLDLILVGSIDTIDAAQWDAVAFLEPYEPYRVQQMADTPPADDVLDGWLIPDSMTVDADFDAGTDTSLDVDVTPAIATSADEMPLRIRAAGVLLEVTAVGAPSGTVQTLTVTQTPLNGVEKTIAAGTVAEVADPLVLSL